MNHWLKKHFQSEQSTVEIVPNYNPITLSWKDEVFDEMPILRPNYMEFELQASFSMYAIECEAKDRRELRWDNVFTSLLTT